MVLTDRSAHGPSCPMGHVRALDSSLSLPFLIAFQKNLKETHRPVGVDRGRDFKGPFKGLFVTLNRSSRVQGEVKELGVDPSP